MPLTLYIRGTSQAFKLVAPHDLGSSESFDKKDIESFSPLTSDSFLKQVPGFSLFRRGSSLSTHPTGQGVSLRGTGTSGASRSVVLLDGVPINDSFGGWVNWSRVTQENLERIQVQQNWGSNHWSSLGLESAIEFTTSEPNRPESVLSYRGGNENTHDLSGSISDATDTLGYRIGGNYFSTEGHTSISAESRGPIDIAADSDHAVGDGKVVFHPSDDTEVYVLHNQFVEHRGNGTPLTNNRSESYLTAAGIDVALNGSDRYRVNIHANNSTFKSTFSSQEQDRSAETPAADQFDVPSEQYGIASDWSTQTTRNYLELGGDILHRYGESNENFRFLEGSFQRARAAGGSQLASGLYAFDRYHIDTPFTIDGFLRLNAWQNSDLYRREGALGSNVTERDDSSPTDTRYYLEPRAQVSYEVTPFTTIRTSITHGHRIPTLNELVRPFRVRNDITEANAELNAEEVTGYNINLERKFDSLSLQTSLFLNRLHNTITNVTLSGADRINAVCGFLPEGGVCRQRQNIDAALVHGVEIQSSYDVSSSLKARINYLYSESKIKNAPNFIEIEGNNIPQLPEHQGALIVEYRRDYASLFLQTRYASRQYDDDLNSLALKQFWTTDLSLRVPLAAAIDLLFSAENIFNKRYDVTRTTDNVVTSGAPTLVLAGIEARF